VIAPVDVTVLKVPISIGEHQVLHHTTLFDTASTTTAAAALVARRGLPFKLTLGLDSSASANAVLAATTGSTAAATPLLTVTLVHISTGTSFDVRHVGTVDASFVNAHPCYSVTPTADNGDGSVQNGVTLSMCTPATFAAGSWTVKVVSTSTSTSKTEATCEGTIVILYNPWYGARLVAACIV
jgi:hypothetical protein